MEKTIEYKSEMTTATLGGREIRLENLPPILSPKKQGKRKREIDKKAYQLVSSHNTTYTETAKMFHMADTTNDIGQTSTAYILSRGVENVGVEEVMQTCNEQVKVIHTVPVMTDAERNAAKKRIGSDLYEIFMRIQAELHLDNGFIKK